MLIDKVLITVKAGDGGNGAVTFSRTGQTAKGGPDGGTGGNGGDIFVQGSNNLYDLHQFRYKKIITAEDGVAGRKKNLYGKNAPHITLFVPIGTLVRDEKTGKSFEITDAETPRLVARGGQGGRGNIEFKSATNQTPRFAESGKKGEERQIMLDLHLIAEIGLIGQPNAGKSSLLSVITNAHPAIGAYPFTTIEPIIGMLGTHPIADIPGLIQGASEGKGLGIQFIKHIEKTKVLVHCIDIASDNPLRDYETIRNELKQYNPGLLAKKELVLLTKTDLVPEEKIRETVKLFASKDIAVLTYSFHDPKSIEVLKSELLKALSS